MVRADIDTPKSVRDASAEKIEEIIRERCKLPEWGIKMTRTVGDLQRLAGNLSKGKYLGSFPTNKTQLGNLGVDGVICSYFAQQVYGYCPGGLNVGLHAKKIATALDLYDWQEETGLEKRTEVKMTNVSSSRLAKSLQKWLPSDLCLQFYDITENIGMLFGSHTTGAYGSVVKLINSDAATKDKSDLLEMVQSISQMYVYASSPKTGDTTAYA